MADPLQPPFDATALPPADNVAIDANSPPRESDTPVALGEPSPGPRLSGLHLILWGVCSGASFLLRGFLWSGFDPWPGAEVLSLACITSLTTGAAWATILAWPLWRRQGYRFPTQGGEWLLIIIGFLMLMSVSTRLAVVFANDLPSIAWLLNLMFSVNVLAPGALCYWLFCGWKTSRPVWTWFFFVMAVYFTVSAYGLFVASPDNRSALMPWLITAGQFGPFVVLAAAVSADLAIRERLPWTHWLGIAVYLINLATTIIQKM